MSLFKVGGVSGAERARAEVRISERSYLCLKCLDDAGSLACIKDDRVVAESTDLQFRFHIFLVSPNKQL